ncbi:ABC transporter permease subunit [Enterococcus saccharolyticus]|uniref:Amino acid ABC transporter amino acid-binding/permease n=1 Tax=Enterococcus saccharolyticus subsp. saccharolyticus ATCC 43076 TaxID=1139996 RepID=S0NJ37_9ENTE|nr:ABC transporter permease subunit [Enterococcus saccharolyticus]EOT28908.1 amino acid ABC transporter amino acid-binding/permease [Enterococcus saccharolyticus subsp. saccharolyticus ATCC 43076]EOT81274.1 amino acid ABC transporter amino acid-binding/permease [Enterococcus saccharolyticus subsp. saccharolyticus ATCC 43076]OJG90276.1 amino acid ABC transporter amino acid-binding/permease [Enterococcus saccharolyticus]
MNKMKKFWLFVLPVFLLLIQFIPLTTVLAETTDPYYEKIQQKGELVVGLSADYAPYEFHAEIDGKDTIVGFDISIAQKIADDMGVKLHIEELGFDALLGALKTGKIDLIISGMAVTEERLEEVDFSDTYMTMKQRVIVRKDDADKYQNTLDFDGVPVGVQKQTTQEALAQNELVGSIPTSLQKIPDVIMNLKNKKVDAAILEGPVAEAYVDRNSDLVFADVEFKDGNKDTAVAVPKNAPVLLESINTSIKEIKDQGLLEAYKKEANELMFHDEQGFFAKYYKFYVNGAGYTIFLAFIGVLFGTILGAFLALMKLAKSKFVRILATIYIEYVRGTPLLVQIFIVYFGTGILGIDMSRLAAGCIALALNSGAYVAEIIRAGITAVNKGQLEAARSLGMNQAQAMRFIIFPQAIKNILPALGNEFVTVIKESSVVSVIGVSELIFQAGNVQGASFKPFLPYVIVSLIYFVLTFTLSRLLGVAERRMSTSD